MSVCLSENIIAQVLDKRLSPIDRQRVDRHIDVCAACRSLLARLVPVGALSADLPLVEDPWIGRFIGSYQLVRHLGRGGMGMVYEAFYSRIGRRAAVKLLLPKFSEDIELVTRFLNEGRATNRIRHPNIIDIYEVDQLADGTAFILMEYLEGETLSARLHRERKLSPSATICLGYQLAAALSAAHSQDIIHRDLKPGNVMLVPDPLVIGHERVKLLDFGIAKVPVLDEETVVQTWTGQLLGTPLFMAPEQYQGARDVTSAADVYSLGVVLYYMLAGHPPFSGTKGCMIAAHMQSAPLPLQEVNRNLPVLLPTLIHAMLAKDPSLRPTMLEVATHLRDLNAVADSTNQLGRRSERTRIPPTSVGFPQNGLQILFTVVAASALTLLASWYGNRTLLPGTNSHGLSVPPAYLGTELTDPAIHSTMQLPSERRFPAFDILNTANKVASTTITSTDSGIFKRVVDVASGNEESSIQRLCAKNILTSSQFASLPATPHRPMMVPIPGGGLIMGSPFIEVGRDPDEQQHPVCIRRGHWMMETEVTQDQYKSVIALTSSSFTEDCKSAGIGSDYPILCIIWKDAILYANRLSQLEGLQQCYQLSAHKIVWPKKDACLGYRLPTEAEWEYAARAGTIRESTGNILQDTAWYWDNSDRHAHPVKQKRPNAWGLYDMMGNVWEWVWDSYSPYSSQMQIDPHGAVQLGNFRVARGGSWDSQPRLVRTANRAAWPPSYRDRFVGFRLIRTVP